jgi:hypothetical protein
VLFSLGKLLFLAFKDLWLAKIDFYEAILFCHEFWKSGDFCFSRFFEVFRYEDLHL